MMPEKIAVLGATGVYARHLIPRLTAAGYFVRALVRRPEEAGIAQACDAEILKADIFDETSLRDALDGCDIGINLATSLPGPRGRGDFAANDHLRRQGVAIWLEACRKAGVSKIIQQSIAMVSASGSTDWSDEDATYTADDDSIATKAIAASLEMECRVRDSGLDFIILRGALFYGPGTGLENDWIARARAGKLRLPGEGDAFVSLVHIADMAEATLAAVKRWPSRQTLIVADDEPTSWKNIFCYLATESGMSEPKKGGQLGFPSFRVSNKRAREALSWAPFYKDFRAGLVR